MIITEYYRNTNDGKVLVKTYSNENFYIKKVEINEIYEMAVDIGYYDYNTQSYKPTYYVYEETQELIKREELIEEGVETNE